MDKLGTRGHKDSRSVMNIHSSCTVLIRHYMKIIIIASLTTKCESVVRVMSGALGCFTDISSPPSQLGSSLF